jgi:hypothetical protein
LIAAEDLTPVGPHWSLRLHLIYVNIFITLRRPKVEPKEMMETYGLRTERQFFNNRLPLFTA